VSLMLLGAEKITHTVIVMLIIYFLQNIQHEWHRIALQSWCAIKKLLTNTLCHFWVWTACIVWILFAAPVCSFRFHAASSLCLSQLCSDAVFHNLHFI